VFGQTKVKLAQNVRNELDGRSYFVSTARMWPLKVWETAVFLGSALGWKNCLYVCETYEPKTIRGTYAKGALEEEAKSTHARTCEMVAREPVARWYMNAILINATKQAAAQNS